MRGDFDEDEYDNVGEYLYDGPMAEETAPARDARVSDDALHEAFDACMLASGSHRYTDAYDTFWALLAERTIPRRAALTAGPDAPKEPQPDHQDKAIQSDGKDRL